MRFEFDDYFFISDELETVGVDLQVYE